MVKLLHLPRLQCSNKNNGCGFLFVILLVLFCSCCFSESSSSRSILSSNHPLRFESFNITLNQTLASTPPCSYSVGIKTSCDSTSSTRDKVSLAFGDAHGNEVYAPKLDDPRSKVFERCSSDDFKIKGPCTYNICYLNLLRNGPDGWMPETVKIYGADPRKVMTFTYNKFLPNGHNTSLDTVRVYVVAYGLGLKECKHRYAGALWRLRAKQTLFRPQYLIAEKITAEDEDHTA